MKYIQTMLAAACLLNVSGAIDAARADDRDEGKHHVTLYTPQGRGDLHACTGFNVSDKTLGLIFEIVDQDGQVSWTPKMRQLAKVEPCP